MGATLLEGKKKEGGDGEGGVGFRVWAPNYDTVAVLTMSDSRSDRWKRTVLNAEPFGFHSGTVDDAGEGTRYLYSLGGRGEGQGHQEDAKKEEEKRRPDPRSRYQPEGVHGPSEVVDPGAFRWTDGEWRGTAREDLVIYELHTGTYTPEGTFESIIPHVHYLRDELGVTAIELMPVAQFPGTRNWGYDGVYSFAPQNSYGGPSGLKRLVDACHAAGLAVLLDVVYNHFGPEGNYLGEYGPYFSAKYRTPWGLAVNYDDRGCDEVRRFVVDNARYWLSEYHFDGLRLDAIHGIFDFSPKHILAEIADAVREEEASQRRKLHVIAESDLNDPRVIEPRAIGGYDLDAQWSDDFHHSVHSYLTGERFSYYSDFGSLDDIVKSILEGFVYDGRYSRFRGMAHGAPPPAKLAGDRFVICIQNHDQVGNRPDGARLASLLDTPALKLAAGLLLLSPYVPLLFMGEEFGERAPFYYFTSHGDPRLVDAVREGRKREHAEAHEHFVDAPFVDPQDPRTFELSKVDHGLLLRPAKNRNREMFQYYRALISMRALHPALRKMDRSRVEVTRSGGAIVMRRWEPGVEELAVVYDFEGRVVVPQGLFDGKWRLIFDSAEKEQSRGERREEGEEGAWQGQRRQEQQENEGDRYEEEEENKKEKKDNPDDRRGRRHGAHRLTVFMNDAYISKAS
jgi:maltooligosyltrehalose trehalohydrolase